MKHIQPQTVSKSAEKFNESNEIPVQEDSPWVVELQNALSPYWSSRLEYRAEKDQYVVVLNEVRKDERAAS